MLARAIACFCTRILSPRLITSDAMTLRVRNLGAAHSPSHGTASSAELPKNKLHIFALTANLRVWWGGWRKKVGHCVRRRDFFRTFFDLLDKVRNIVCMRGGERRFWAINPRGKNRDQQPT